MTTGDFNGDGATDIATTHNESDFIFVLLNLGATEPDPVLTPTTLAFGNVELGSGVVNLSTTIDGGGAYSLVSVPASPLAQATSDTLEVSFTPTSLGLVTGMGTLATNAVSSPTITIALNGTGIDTQAPTSAATAPTGSLT